MGKSLLVFTICLLGLKLITKENMINFEENNAYIAPGTFAAAIQVAKEYKTLDALIKEYVEIGCGVVSPTAPDYPKDIANCPGNSMLQVCGKQIINKNCMLLLLSYSCDASNFVGLYFYDVKNKKLNTETHVRIGGRIKTEEAITTIKGKLDETGRIIQTYKEVNNKTKEIFEITSKYQYDPFGCKFIIDFD